MAKIFFPFADQPKQLPFLIDKTIRFPFTIDNLLYYCDISPGGITMYLHPETISIDSLAIQMVLMEIKDMLYLANGEIQPDGVPIVELSKKSYVTFLYDSQRNGQITEHSKCDQFAIKLIKHQSVHLTK